MSDNSESILCELLVLRCRRGDTEAWRELTHLFERRLLYYLRRLVDDERDAWDLLQQTWLGAFRNLRTLEQPRALRTWLYRIAHHQAVSHRRQRGVEPTAGEADQVDLDEVADDCGDEIAIAADAAERVHAALAQLPVAFREVLTLRFLEDLSVDEAAAVLNVPAGTVKSRLFHAKRALRAVLEFRTGQGGVS
ncbi:MAG TPA: sigma-70 family RNA polymerase sigma factor [Tepidisphaeraceae bacterium]|nr:sigma-70 family RNA polymerase sigma factor [Tepidisphaeraceae bacterium]